MTSKTTITCQAEEWATLINRLSCFCWSCGVFLSTRSGVPCRGHGGWRRQVTAGFPFGDSQRCHEAKEPQRELVRVAVAGAELSGDVRDPVQVQDAGDGVADGGHGPVRAADAAGVLPEYDIADVMMHLDGPVAAQVSEQVSGAGLARGQAGDAEDS